MEDRNEVVKMIEIWTAGLSELIIPPHARKAYLSYIIEEDGKMIDSGYENMHECMQRKDMMEDVASYYALIGAIEKIRRQELDGEDIFVRSSSSVVVRQITKQRSVRTERLKPLFYKAKILVSGMDIVFERIPKRKNRAYKLLIDRREAEKYFQF